MSDGTDTDRYLNDGTYDPATVVGSWLGKTKSGKERVEIAFEYEGQRAIYHGYLTDKAWPYTEEALKNLGWNPADHDFNIERLNEGERSEICGNDAQIEVKVETWVRDDGSEGRMSKVSWVNPCGATNTRGGGMDTDEAKTFAAKFKAKMLAKRGQAGRKATASKPASATEPMPDDDIPF